jgi:phosphoribosyl 1,2-cyclic phosphodiesterase
MKNFRITERVKFQFVNNWIDATNTPQWCGSTGTCNTASKSCFGQIANQQTQSNYPRQIQLAGRITF